MYHYFNFGTFEDTFLKVETNFCHDEAHEDDRIKFSLNLMINWATVTPTKT